MNCGGVRRGIRISQHITRYESYSTKCFLNEIKKYRPLPPDREIELIVKAQRGDFEAGVSLLLHNARFIYSVVRQYEGYGVPNDEMLLACLIAFFRAIYNFDVTRGVRFISYAVWEMRRDITSVIAGTGWLVSIPTHVLSRFYKLRGIISGLEHGLNRTPSLEELAQAMNMTVDEVGRIMSLLMHGGVSLDKPFDGEDGVPIIDTIKDIFHGYENDPDKYMERKSFEGIARKFAKKLNLTERMVFELYMGLGRGSGGTPKSPEEIASIMNMSVASVEKVLRRIYSKFLNFVKRSKNE